MQLPFQRLACAGLFLSAILAASPVFAQPGGKGPSNSVEAAFSYSGSSDAEFAGRTAGDLSVSAARVDVKLNRAVSRSLFLSYGGSYQRFAVDASSVVPVPETLQAVSFELGATRLIDSKWSATLAVSPGFYSVGTSINGDAFNLPGVLFATWRATPTFGLSGGLRVDAFSDNAVLPFIGFRWQATPEVTVSFGAPRTEVAYSLGGGSDLYFGAGFQGGSFHTDDPGVRPPAGYPSLRDTYVDYREIRVGGGIRWALSPTMRLDLEAGWMIDRRFDYYDRSLEVKTDGAVYGRVGLTAKF